MSQNSQKNIDLEKEKSASGGSLTLPVELPRHLDIREHVYLLLYETIALWIIILTNKHREVINEETAEQELKDTTYLEETLILMGETILPREMPVMKEIFDRTKKSVPGAIAVYIDGISLINTSMKPPPGLSKVAYDILKLPYEQRKIVVFQYAIEFLVYNITQLKKTSHPSNQIDELTTRTWHLIELYETYTAQQARVEKPTEPAILTKPEYMRKLGERIGVTSLITAPLLDPASPSVQLWQAIDMSNRQVAAQRGTPLLDESRQRVLQTYLTTQSSLTDLKPLAGVTTKQGVQDQLRRSISKVFEYLPGEVREKYKTPEDVLRERTAKPTELTVRKQKQGLYRLRRLDTGKREFSGTHKTHLSEAAARREQRKREMQQVTSTPDQP